MTFKIGDVVVLAVEPDMKCQECGKDAETRPYGPGGKRICFACATKDPETERACLRRFRELIK